MIGTTKDFCGTCSYIKKTIPKPEPAVCKALDKCNRYANMKYYVSIIRKKFKIVFSHRWEDCGNGDCKGNNPLDKVCVCPKPRPAHCRQECLWQGLIE